MQWFKNRFKRKSPPVTLKPSASGPTIGVNAEFQAFMDSLGPEFWPVCECFTGDMRLQRITQMYDLAGKAADNFMMNMTIQGFCVKSGPVVLALIVNRVLAVGAAGTAQEAARGREPTDAAMLHELTERLADFQKRQARLTTHAMEKLGCTRS